MMRLVARLSIVCTILATSAMIHAWSPLNFQQHQQKLQVQPNAQLLTTTTTMESSRRSFLERSVAMIAATSLAAAGVATPAFAAESAETMIDELVSSKEKVQSIPELLKNQEWDKVRTILKTPPVNKLWNLGDSQNTLLRLAKETGNVELFELKDDLAYSLQMCDQLTYDNVFVYYQPGSGKINIKEPTEFALKAVRQIAMAIDESK